MRLGRALAKVRRTENKSFVRIQTLYFVPCGLGADSSLAEL